MDDYWSKAAKVEQILDAMPPIESGGNPRAVSPKGARGLYQIMPDTARQYGVNPDDLYDPKVGRHTAGRYLMDMMNRYQGDTHKALAAYNAGPGRVDTGRPLPHETRSYISRFMSALGSSEASAAEGPPSGTSDYWAKAKVEPPATSAPAKEGYWDKAIAQTKGSLPPEAGSVFSREPTTGEQLKSDVKTGVKLATGIGVPLAAGALLGPEASALARIGMQALAGAITPFAEYGVAKLMGEQPELPGVRDALSSAAWNAGATSLGEGISTLAGGASAVRPEMEAFPGPQSRATVRQAMRNRDFLKQIGLNDAQIDDVLKSPDMQTRLAEQIRAGQQYKSAYQNIKNYSRGMFSGQYTGILGSAPGKVDVGDVGSLFEQLAMGQGQHQLTPAFREWLIEKADELSVPASLNVDSPEGVERVQNILRGDGWTAKNLRDYTPQEQLLEAQNLVKARPPTEMNAEELQHLRTELDENVPSGATNLDKSASAEIRQALTGKIKGQLSPAAGKALDALDAEYGRYMDVLDRLNPQDQRYGEQVANAIFDPMIKNPGDALKFVDLAQQAEQSRPGEVMPQLREAFVNKVMSEARTPGAPMEELRALRKLQTTWGTDKNARAVLSGIFGKDFPLADPVTFTKVLGIADNPRAVIDAVGKPSVMRSVLSSPYMQAYATSGVLATLSGVQGGSLWMSMTGQKGPQAQMTALASLLIGPAVFGKVLGSGNAGLQRAMVGFMTNPNARTMIRYMGAFTGATAGGLISLPNETSATPATTPPG